MTTLKTNLTTIKRVPTASLRTAGLYNLISIGLLKLKVVFTINISSCKMDWFEFEEADH
jgi:hypothetical protein